MVAVLEFHLNLFQEVVKLGERVREAVSKIHFLCLLRAVRLGRLKVIREAEFVKIPHKGRVLRTPTQDVGPPVLYVVPSFMPLVVLGSLCYSDSHAVGVERHWLGEVAYVKGHSLLAIALRRLH